MATKLIHCKTYSTFNSKKLSALVENTSYTVGVDGSRITGTPEINYLDIVFIQDTAQIWTHGKLYENTTYSFSGGTNSFSVTPHNGSKSGNSITVQVTPSIANASSAASGLMSKTTAEALSSYHSYTFLYDVKGEVTPGEDKVNVHWTQLCDYVDYSKNDFTENTKSHSVDFDIPVATESLPGVMSAADKTKLLGIASGAEVNVQANWAETNTSSDAYIKNKPTIPVIDSALNATSTNAIQNKVVSTSINSLINEIGDLSDRIDDMDGIVSANTEKLGGIASGAEVNQNAFSNVKVGSTTIAADAKTDTLTLVAGSNITITPDATNDKITIAGNYSNASTSAAGLMSASDKSKLDSIESGADSIVISKSTTGGKTTASFTVNGGTPTTFDIYGITDTYNPTSASSTYSISQLGVKNLYNAVLPKAGGDMNSGARISASGGSLYLGNANNSGWLYLQDCASLKNDATNTYWYIKNDGNSLFQTADIKTTLTLNNNTGGYNGIIFKFGDAVGTHIYQTCDASNYYSLVFDGNVFIGGEGKGNLNINGELKALGEKFYVLSDGAYWRSDKRSKDNISNARNLNIDSLIREFDWKDTGNHSWGFIAQELKEILPEAVNYDELIDRYSVNYDVAHSAAIASLSAKIEYLESRIKELEK